MREENLKNANEMVVLEQNSTTVEFGPCDICKKVELNPTDLSETARLLQVNVRLNNVCPYKKVVLSCSIVFNGNLIHKTQTFTLDGDGCQETERVFDFVLPDTQLCSVLSVEVTASASYINPCPQIV